MSHPKRLADYGEDDLSQLMAVMTPEELEEFEKLRGSASPASASLTGPDDLATALQNCINARKLIPKEQKIIDTLIKKAESDTEYQARCYQRDLIAWQLNRAADTAQERVAHLSKIVTYKHEQAEKKKIADGPEGAIYWFKYYAWAFDPRPDSPLALMPLVLFPFQENYIRWLEETIFIYRKGGLAEKCRDMGLSLVTVDWIVLKWATIKGFIALLGSYKQDLIDDKDNMDTLFQKARFQIELMPKWQHPRGFDQRRHMGYMKIINPEHKATITGQAPTAKWGRAGRASMAFGDEWAHWPDGGYPQHTAVSFTTKTVIKGSTVYGMQNQFAEERHSVGPDGKPNANVFTMNWHDHPWKDQRWYNGLEPGYFGPPMSKELIAQEVDINYEAAQPGRVWPMFSPPHSVITHSELIRTLKQHGVAFPPNEDGRPRIPMSPVVQVARLNDRGATMGHRNAWLWAWRLPEHYAFSDCVFIHREWLAPIGVTFRKIVETVREFEAPDYEDEKIVLSQNSHEAESERINYAEEYGLEFEGWKTDYEAGIAQITEFLTIIETDRPNPFRPALKGRARLIIVCQDGQGELAYKNDTPFVSPARDFLGMANLRRQIGAYHYPKEEAGKAVGQMRPAKIDDDLVDDLRALAIAWADLTAGKTQEEEIADRLKEMNAGFAEPEIEKLTGWDRQGRMAALNQARRKLEKEFEDDNATGSAILDWQDRFRKGAML
jgi:hypothetical protein